MGARPRHDARHPLARPRVPLPGRAVRAAPPVAHRLFRGRDGDARDRFLDARPPPRAPLPALDAPSAERHPRRVGAAPRRARAVVRHGARIRARANVARVDPPARRAAALARELLRLARTADLRRGSPPPGVAHPRRARVLFRHRDPDVVAARSGLPAAAAVGRPRRATRSRPSSSRRRSACSSRSSRGRSTASTRTRRACGGSHR